MLSQKTYYWKTFSNKFLKSHKKTSTINTTNNKLNILHNNLLKKIFTFF